MSILPFSSRRYINTAISVSYLVTLVACSSGTTDITDDVTQLGEPDLKAADESVPGIDSNPPIVVSSGTVYELQESAQADLGVATPDVELTSSFMETEAVVGLPGSVTARSVGSVEQNGLEAGVTLTGIYAFDSLSSSGNDSQIIVGTQPGDAQCLDFGNQTQDFGHVSDDDWRQWMPDFNFSVNEEYISVIDDNNNKVLRHKYNPSSVGSDRVVVRSDIEPYRTYRIMQSVYLEPGWEWGGDTREGGKLGFGLGGGSSPSGGTVDPTGFTARLTWLGNSLGGGQYDGTARLVIYSYNADRPSNFGENSWIENYSVPIGEWFDVIFEISLNSSTSASDGSIRAWINGDLLLQRGGIAWQTEGGTPVIDKLGYASFYGGANSGWAPSKPTFARIKDVCFSPVVGGYSGIDPDSGRINVETPSPITPTAEVSVAYSCMAGKGRFDANIVNSQTVQSAYTFKLKGPRSRTRTRTIEFENLARMSVVGRPPGTYTVEVLRDGKQIHSDSVYIDCTAPTPPVSSPEVTIVNACAAGNGFVRFQMINPTNSSRSYDIEFENVRTRSATVEAYGQALRGISGRPDGVYEYLVRTGSTVVKQGTVEIDCT